MPTPLDYMSVEDLNEQGAMEQEPVIGTVDWDTFDNLSDHERKQQIAGLLDNLTDSENKPPRGEHD